jgi:branched-chain amino acid transport system substrate-binding protein
MRKMHATYPRRPLAAGLALCALAAAAGCGSDDEPARPDGGLTVYASLPSQGPSAERGRAVAAGVRLALEDAGGRAGGRRVRLVQLDSSDDPDEAWDPDHVEENARKAGDDDSAVAYLGELELGASAVSVPVTNSDDLLQVAPADGLPSLTQPDPGGGGEGPVRYYPEATRTFIRLVPHDGLRARLLVDRARRLGARRLAVVRDDGVFGRELANWAFDAALRMKLPAEIEEARDGADPEDVARDVAEGRPEAVIHAGAGGADADELLAAIARALPSAQLLTATPTVGPTETELVQAAAPPREYPAGARRLLRRIAARASAESLPAEALYGYEAMRLVLDAIESSRAGPGDTQAVVRAALAARRRDAAHGAYSVVPGGDVSTSVLATYRAGRFLGFRDAAEVELRPGPSG